jgi:hypothetical protein
VPQEGWPAHVGSLPDRPITDIPGPPMLPGAVAAGGPSASQAVARPGFQPAAAPGRPGQQARPGRPESGAAPAPRGGGAGLRMTTRGGVVAMFTLFFVGTLAAGWLHLGLLTGVSFVAGCALAARYTQSDGLLTVVITPPLIFMVGLVCAEAFTSHADSVRHTVTSTAEGTFLTLAAVAPWLFGGVILGIIVAMFRGLPQCVRELRAELRGDTGPRSQPGRRSPR